MKSFCVRPMLAAAVLALFAVPASAAGEAPFSFDRAPGKLPKIVVPTDYTIEITPNIPAMTLAGTERVALEVRRPTSTIAFNALNMTIAHAALDGRPVAAVNANNGTQVTTLRLAQPATVGRHVLTMAYRGKLETSAQGLFVQSYVNAGGKPAKMLSTQLESTDARRMFPGWDEPAFRATFQLAMTVPAEWATLSNMPAASHVVHGALATTTFERTPKMPSYLVEFTAGDIADVQAQGPDGIMHRVWAVRGEQNDGRYALANSQQILAYYNDYFGIRFPLPKLDSIAIPGGFGGAMENWGAITYNDQILLAPPNADTHRREDIYATQAHEMAHQWFGDLVTMGWWDDIWLNESFASWMAAKATDRFNPTWKWFEEEDTTKENAMNADARLASHAIQQHVVDETQADASFDPAITYDKGQNFLRMLEAYLGDDTFRSGIRSYEQAHKYSNATTADLWNALAAASGKDVATLAGGWTSQPGFPLVSVHATCDGAGNRTLALSQQRFVLGGTDTSHERWMVPMRIASGNGAAQNVLFVNDGQTVSAGKCGDVLSANAGDIGYYRVAYDDATWKANLKAFAMLADTDKIAMLDDQWALVRGGRAPLASFLSLASSMGTSLDARAWEQIMTALGTIEHDERGTATHDKFVAYAAALDRPVAAALGWDPKPGEDPQAARLRVTVLEQLGTFGDPATVAQAKQRFATFRGNRSSLAPDVQEAMLQIVGTNADQATFDELHALAKGTHDETDGRRIYAALALARDPQLARQVLAIATSSEIPPQAAESRLYLIARASDWNAPLAWQFFQANRSTLLAPFATFERVLIMANLVPNAFSDAAPVDELVAWLKQNVPANVGPTLDRSIETLRDDANERAALAKEAGAFVASAPAQPAG